MSEKLQDFQIQMPDGRMETVDMSGKVIRKYSAPGQMTLAMQAMMVFAAINRFLGSIEVKPVKVEINSTSQIVVHREDGVNHAFDTRIPKGHPLGGEPIITEGIRERVNALKGKPVDVSLRDLVSNIYDIDNVSDVFIREALGFANMMMEMVDQATFQALMESKQARAEGKVH